MEGKKITSPDRLPTTCESNRRRLEYLKRLVRSLRLFGNAEWLNQIRGTPLQVLCRGIDPFRNT